MSQPEAPNGSHNGGAPFASQNGTQDQAFQHHTQPQHEFVDAEGRVFQAQASQPEDGEYFSAAQKASVHDGLALHGTAGPNGLHSQPGHEEGYLGHGSNMLDVNHQYSQKIEEINKKSRGDHQDYQPNNEDFVNPLQAMDQQHTGVANADLMNGGIHGDFEPLTQQQIQEPLQAAAADVDGSGSSASDEVGPSTIPELIVASQPAEVPKAMPVAGQQAATGFGYDPASGEEAEHEELPQELLGGTAVAESAQKGPYYQQQEAAEVVNEEQAEAQNDMSSGDEAAGTFHKYLGREQSGTAHAIGQEPPSQSPEQVQAFQEAQDAVESYQTANDGQNFEDFPQGDGQPGHHEDANFVAEPAIPIEGQFQPTFGQQQELGYQEVADEDGEGLDAIAGLIGHSQHQLNEADQAFLGSPDFPSKVEESAVNAATVQDDGDADMQPPASAPTKKGKKGGKSTTRKSKKAKQSEVEVVQPEEQQSDQADEQPTEPLGDVSSPKKSKRKPKSVKTKIEAQVDRDAELAAELGHPGRRRAAVAAAASINTRTPAKSTKSRWAEGTENVRSTRSKKQTKENVEEQPDEQEETVSKPAPRSTRSKKKGKNSKDAQDTVVESQPLAQEEETGGKRSRRSKASRAVKKDSEPKAQESDNEEVQEQDQDNENQDLQFLQQIEPEVDENENPQVLQQTAEIIDEEIIKNTSDQEMVDEDYLNEVDDNIVQEEVIQYEQNDEEGPIEANEMPEPVVDYQEELHEEDQYHETQQDGYGMKLESDSNKEDPVVEQHDEVVEEIEEVEEIEDRDALQEFQHQIEQESGHEQNDSEEQQEEQPLVVPGDGSDAEYPQAELTKKKTTFPEDAEMHEDDDVPQPREESSSHDSEGEVVYPPHVNEALGEEEHAAFVANHPEFFDQVEEEEPDVPEDFFGGLVDQPVAQIEEEQIIETEKQVVEGSDDVYQEDEEPEHHEEVVQEEQEEPDVESDEENQDYQPQPEVYQEEYHEIQHEPAEEEEPEEEAQMVDHQQVEQYYNEQQASESQEQQIEDQPDLEPLPYPAANAGELDEDGEEDGEFIPADDNQLDSSLDDKSYITSEHFHVADQMDPNTAVQQQQPNQFSPHLQGQAQYYDEEDDEPMDPYGVDAEHMMYSQMMMNMSPNQPMMMQSPGKQDGGTGSPEQRKRGRPRKHPIVEDKPKRGRGRPRKEETALADGFSPEHNAKASPEGKRSRGRPRKDESVTPVKQQTVASVKDKSAKKSASPPPKKSPSPSKDKALQREREQAEKKAAAELKKQQLAEQKEREEEEQRRLEAEQKKIEKREAAERKKQEQAEKKRREQEEKKRLEAKRIKEEEAERKKEAAARAREDAKAKKAAEKAKAEAKRQAELAAAKKRKEAEEKKIRDAEAKARRQEEDKKRQAEEKKKKEVAEKKRREAEKAARLAEIAAEKKRKEAEERKKKEAEERRQREQEEKERKRREAEDKKRKEADARKKREAEEKRKHEAAEKQKRDQAKKAAEAKKQKDLERHRAAEKAAKAAQEKKQKEEQMRKRDQKAAQKAESKKGSKSKTVVEKPSKVRSSLGFGFAVDSDAEEEPMPVLGKRPFKQSNTSVTDQRAKKSRKVEMIEDEPSGLGAGLGFQIGDDSPRRGSKAKSARAGSRARSEAPVSNPPSKSKQTVNKSSSKASKSKQSAKASKSQTKEKSAPMAPVSVDRRASKRAPAAPEPKKAVAPVKKAPTFQEKRSSSMFKSNPFGKMKTLLATPSKFAILPAHMRSAKKILARAEKPSNKGREKLKIKKQSSSGFGFADVVEEITTQRAAKAKKTVESLKQAKKEAEKSKKSTGIARKLSKKLVQAAVQLKKAKSAKKATTKPAQAKSADSRASRSASKMSKKEVAHKARMQALMKVKKPKK